MSLVVEGELANLQTIIEGLSKSASLGGGDLKTLQAEALRLVQGYRSNYPVARL